MTELIARPGPPAAGDTREEADPSELLADWFAAALSTIGELSSAAELSRDAALHPRLMRFADGRVKHLPVHRWAGPVTAADRTMLSRAPGPVLDVGCGPGRLTAALHERGTDVVGLDLDEAIPVLARRAGAPVLLASVWGELPRTGRWRTVLLADGNVGIGGEPVRLLRRLRPLLRADGTVLVELQPAAEPHVPGTCARVRLEELGRHSTWFGWGLLHAADVQAVAAAAGLRVAERWGASGREFAALAVA